MKYEEIGKQIGRLVDKKNYQYGDSFNRTGKILKILYPEGVQPSQYKDLAGIIRVLDKLSRIATGNPDIENPWEDIAGYGLLGSKNKGEKE